MNLGRIPVMRGPWLPWISFFSVLLLGLVGLKWSVLPDVVFYPLLIAILVAMAIVLWRLRRATTVLPLLVRCKAYPYLFWEFEEGVWLVIFFVDFTNQSDEGMSLDVTLIDGGMDWSIVPETDLELWHRFTRAKRLISGKTWSQIDNQLTGIFNLAKQETKTKAILIRRYRTNADVEDTEPKSNEVFIHVVDKVSNRWLRVDVFGHPVSLENKHLSAG